MNRSRTWKDVVAEALEQLGGEAHLRDITRLALADPKAASNSRVEEKVRQVVRDFKMFQAVKDGSGVYRLAPLSVPTAAPLSSTKDITDEIQGRLLYIGQANDFQTFAPAADCTMRQFAGKPLDTLVTMRDSLASVERATTEERKTMAQIDVIWFEEKDGDMLPVCAFEVENSTQVLTGLERLAKIPRLFGTRLFIVGEDDGKKAKFDQYLANPVFKKDADRFRFRRFDDVRALCRQAEAYSAIRAENEQALQDWGLA